MQVIYTDLIYLTGVIFLGIITYALLAGCARLGEKR
jgi:hypothetical protein